MHACRAWDRDIRSLNFYVIFHSDLVLLHARHTKMAWINLSLSVWTISLIIYRTLTHTYVYTV